MNKIGTRRERFDNLVKSYGIAVYLSEQLIDSGLLERKIKVGIDTDRVDGLMRQFVPALANDIRTAQKNIQLLVNPKFAGDGYFTTSSDIARAYFDDLASRGPEWENADLEDLFTEYKRQAEEEMELERDRW